LARGNKPAQLPKLVDFIKNIIFKGGFYG